MITKALNIHHHTNYNFANRDDCWIPGLLEIIDVQDVLFMAGKIYLEMCIVRFKKMLSTELNNQSS